MNKPKLWNLLTVLMIVSVLLASCAGGGSQATQAPAEVQPTAGAEKKVASSGFECPEPQSPAEVTSKEINLFVWTEYIPQDMIECFELIYDVKVNRDEYSSNEEMYAKLAAGGSSYDLAQPTDYVIQLMVRQNLLQKLDKSKLTVMGNIDPSYLNLSFDPGNEYTLPYQAGADSIVYNSDKVDTPPQSWNDLWKPEFAGRMVFLDDSRAVIGMTLLTLGYDVNTKDEKQLEEAKVKLAELVKNIKIFDSDSPKTPLIAGDADLGMTWTGEAFLAAQENPAIKFIYPVEGAIVWQDNWVIPASASHLDAVYAWLNYTLQDDIFWLMLRDFPYTNPNKAALEYAKTHQPDLYNAYMNSNVTNMPAEDMQKGHRIEDVGDATPLYDRIWTEVKGGE